MSTFFRRENVLRTILELYNYQEIQIEEDAPVVIAADDDDTTVTDETAKDEASPAPEKIITEEEITEPTEEKIIIVNDVQSKAENEQEQNNSETKKREDDLSETKNFQPVFPKSQFKCGEENDEMQLFRPLVVYGAEEVSGPQGIDAEGTDPQSKHLNISPRERSGSDNTFLKLEVPSKS